MSVLTFTGARELVQALKQLPREVRQKVLVGAVLAGGAIIQQAASERAPRDPRGNRRRGLRLADSIRTVVADEMPSAVSINVTTKDPIAPVVEFGHQQVPRGPTRKRVSVTRVSKTGRVSAKLMVDPEHQRVRRGATGFTPAKPFMRPAFEENREAVLTKIGEVLGAGIEIEAAALGRKI